MVNGEANISLMEILVNLENMCERENILASYWRNSI